MAEKSHADRLGTAALVHTLCVKCNEIRDFGTSGVVVAAVLKQKSALAADFVRT